MSLKVRLLLVIVDYKLKYQAVRFLSKFLFMKLEIYLIIHLSIEACQISTR